MKQDDHERLTREAVARYGDLRPGSFADRLAARVEEVAEGSTEADIAPVFTRITNWHFYPENPALTRRLHWQWGVIPLKVTPTSDVVLGRRLRELRKHLTWVESNRFGDLVGRVLHHIQDMSTPTHVTPVYHDPALPDPFESWSVPRTGAVLEALRLAPEDTAGAVADDPPDPEALYDQAAKATLAHLFGGDGDRFEVRIDGTTERAGWGLFWRRYGDPRGVDDHDPMDFDGFGRFGPLGCDFGTEVIERNGKRYEVAPAVYAGLHAWIMEKALLDSLRALRSIEAMWEAAMARRDYRAQPPEPGPTFPFE